MPRPVGAILLAAGSGSRMGKLKQLLPYRGTTLIRYAVEQAVDAAFDPIVVVLGAEAEQVRNEIDGNSRIVLVENPAWQTGIGSSVATGARLLRSYEARVGIAVLLGDQPLVTTSHLRSMLARFRLAGYSAIIAAKYGSTVGVPAVFPSSMWSLLERLKPEQGARSLLRDADQPVIPFDLPEGALDIDTPDDFARLRAGDPTP